MKNSIIEQYNNRELIFKNKNILPEFELIILKALYFDDPRFKTWSEILEYYKSEILKLLRALIALLTASKATEVAKPL
jgi:hypothetical protein